MSIDDDMIEAAKRIAKPGGVPEQVYEAVGFKKFDQGKPKMSLLPPIAMRQLAEVLTFGAKKYDKFNWTKGCDWSRYSDAALRHLFAWLGGEDTDKESGLPHLAHAMCCLAFLLESAEKGYGVDDRHIGGPDRSLITEEEKNEQTARLWDTVMTGDNK